MVSKNSGILLGRVNDLYSTIYREVSGNHYSIVGIYYFEKDIMNLLIYRIFDGTVYPFLTQEVNFDILSTHKLVDEMIVYEFDQQCWSLDGNKDFIIDRIKSSINKCLIQGMGQPDYRSLIMNILGVKVDKIYNGYYRVNEILLNIIGEDSISRKSSIHNDIIYTKYLKEGINITKNYKKDHRLPSFSDVSLDSHRRIIDLSNNIVNLFLNDEAYRDFILEMIGFSSVERKKGEEFYDSTNKYFSIQEEVIKLNNILSNLSESFESGQPAIISMNELIKIHDSLATKSGLDKFTTKKKIAFESISSIVIIDEKGYDSDSVKVTLKSGDVMYIPCNGDGVELLSDDERLEILRYVLSLRNGTNFYNGLLDKLVKECANKYKRIYFS